MRDFSYASSYVMKEILLSIGSKETRCAELSQGRVQNLTVDKQKSRQVPGNIYRGEVKNTLSNIQSAFVDIDEGENGFIHISDIMENTKKFEQLFDMDFEREAEIEAKEADKEADIAQVLQINQSVLVQVVKEPIGSKGARLTSSISLPGRYLVFLPNTPHCGVSRRIEDRQARERLKRILRSLDLPEGSGMICRTISRNATQEALIEEAQELFDTWQTITEAFQATSGPALLYEESDLVKRTVMRAVDKKYGRLLVDDHATFQRCKQIYQRYEAEHPLRIELYRDKVPMFERFGVEKEIEKALRRKVWITGGGYLYFDHTEAMYTVDVNSGRGTSDKSGNVEEALVQINLGAAEEIARQLRLRNVGGLIILDFIDMRSRKSRRRVLEHLRECMKEDSAKCTILGMSDFGLVEMTRQRKRESLAQMILTACPYCSGKGTIKSYESMSTEIERALQKVTQIQEQYSVRIVTHPALNAYLDQEDKKSLTKLAEDKFNARIEFDADDTLHLNDIQFFSTITGDPISV